MQKSMKMSFFGMLLYIFDVCPENRDESKGNSIVKLWLQFIPIFGALHSQLCKGHIKKRHLHATQKVSFTYNHETPFGLDLGAERLMAERERWGHLLRFLITAVRNRETVVGKGWF
jgi:hypothetical protein